MLNINDVRERLKKNPEPKIVDDIRQNIINRFNKLTFIEEGHKYYLNNDDGTKTELKSVSATIHDFVEYVDWDTITKNYAKKHDMTIEQVKRKWRENNLLSTNNGTSTHLYGEMYHWFVTDKLEMFNPIIQPQYEEGYFIPYGKKQEAIQKYNEDLFNIYDMYPLMVETQVYTNKYAGTFDKLVYYKHPTDETKSGLIIVDYKTNITLESDYNRKNNKTLLPPFDNYIEEPLSHYTIQLSCYQIPLEDMGLKIIARRLIWLKPDGTYEQIKIPDITKDVRKALNI